MQMRFCEIAGKQVINLCDGRVVGLVNDVAFDVKSNKLLAIYARTTQPFVKKMLPWLFPCEEIEISMQEIENICRDVILVRFR